MATGEAGTRGRRQSRDLGARPARLFESRSWHPRACQDLKRGSSRGAARRAGEDRNGRRERGGRGRTRTCVVRVGVVRRVDACARVPQRGIRTSAFETVEEAGRSDIHTRSRGRTRTMIREARLVKRRRDIIYRDALRSPPRCALHLRSSARDDGAHDPDTTRYVSMHITHSRGTLPNPRVYRRLPALAHTARMTSSSSSAFRTTPETRVLRSSCSSLETISSPKPATSRLRAVVGLSPRLWM